MTNMGILTQGRRKGPGFYNGTHYVPWWSVDMTFDTKADVGESDTDRTGKEVIISYFEVIPRGIIGFVPIDTLVRSTAEEDMSDYWYYDDYWVAMRNEGTYDTLTKTRAAAKALWDTKEVKSSDLTPSATTDPAVAQHVLGDTDPSLVWRPDRASLRHVRLQDDVHLLSHGRYMMGFDYGTGYPTQTAKKAINRRHSVHGLPFLMESGDDHRSYVVAHVIVVPPAIKNNAFTDGARYGSLTKFHDLDFLVREFDGTTGYAVPLDADAVRDKVESFMIQHEIITDGARLGATNNFGSMRPPANIQVVEHIRPVHIMRIPYQKVISATD